MTITEALQQNKMAFGLMCTDEYTNEEMRAKAREIGFGVFECYENNSDNEWEELGRFNEYNFAQELTYHLIDSYTEPVEDEYETKQIFEEDGMLTVADSPGINVEIHVASSLPDYAGYLYDDGKMCSEPVRYFGADGTEMYRPSFERVKAGEITIKRPYPNGNVVFKKTKE